jgi:uncharacterized protein YyaL (SSP411 family)
LINETSPYLLQHAHNPVDWYPWGPEALARAKGEDKPILLSVGYSACHWCHVMEHESFENKVIAAQMNENFVCIKVDREERPDLDSIYMTAVQAMTGRGGWPMTVFLTPDGKPFYGGTYYPPEDRMGMPGFPRVLKAVSDAYRSRRSEVLLGTQTLLQQMRQLAQISQGVEPLTTEALSLAYHGLSSSFDDQHGGFGTEPKFPQPMTYEFLLRQYLRTQDPAALDMVTLTLDRMASGGIYDHLGGGFHRYSVDTYWLVPHFEKMLYDNALLVRLYLHAYQVTGKPLYRRVVEETLDYVLREMTSPEGGFYSAQDADSEGIEGKFYVWRPEEVIEVLGKEDGGLVNRYFGVTTHGNFEGHTILNVREDSAEVLEKAGLPEERASEFLVRIKGKLLAVRSRRVPPARDDKVLTAWNALMIAAFAEAANVLNRPDYAAAAEKNASLLLGRLRQDGRLLRTYKDGKAKLNGYLEDYAFLINGLIAVHEATFGARWLKEAIGLADAMVDLFWDERSGQFYDTGRDHEELLMRPREVTDNAIPSGNSMAAESLLRLAVYTGNQEFQRKAAAALRSVRELMVRYPTGAGHWLCALDFYLSKPKEIVIVGRRGAADTKALVAEVFRHHTPNKALLGLQDDGDDLDGLPLAEGRTMLRDQATAYVCEGYVCQLPVTAPKALAGQLTS